MNNINKTETELLKESSFCEEYRSEIPDGYYALYLANPKNRWKRNQFNHALADRLLNTHDLTFTNVKMIRYGEFYIFKIDEKMESWGLDKLKEFCITHPGLHYSSNIWRGEWFDEPSPNSMDSIRKEEEERVAKLNKANGTNQTASTYIPNPEENKNTSQYNLFQKIDFPKVKSRFNEIKSTLLTKLFKE